MNQVETLKKQGNDAFTAGKWDEAITHFSQAIELDPKNHILYSNRSASFTSAKRFEEALKDAEITVQLNPNWAKGYSRKGAALHGLKRLPDAAETYRTGLKLEPTNQQMKQALLEVERELVQMETGENPEDILKNIFSGDLLEKARNHPKTRDFVKQPDFVAMVQDIQKNPNSMEKYANDPRIATLMTVLFMSQTGQTPEQASFEAQQRFEEEQRKEKQRREEEDKKRKEEEEKKKMELKPEHERKAEAEKSAGNEAYKKKEFVVALTHYAEALRLDPKNVTLYLNVAAVHFETGKYEECIKNCEIAIEEGKKYHVDFQIFAKAYARIGNALSKQGNLTAALKAYNESLSNFRNPEVVKAAQKIEKQMEEEAKKSYVDPVKSAEAKERGNSLVKDGKYPEAIKEYEEAIKRNPEDHTLYANRALCYMKLQALDEGIRDCDECIKRKPEYAKAYIRKGLMCMTKKDYHRAMQAFDEGLKHEPTNPELKDGLQKCYFAMNVEESELSQEEKLKRATQDPEVAEILSDPVMRQILSTMTSDPKAARDHLKNPVIAAKIEKLVKAGIVGTK